MHRFAQLSLVVLAAVTSLPMTLSGSASAADVDKKFFKQAEGNWSGPGEIIAGKYKGTKFVCNFTGSTPERKAGMTLDGGCRVGLFSQKMTATVERSGAGYRGKFLDGAAGEGMDIVSGNVIGNNKGVFGINRKKLKGAMIAKLDGDDAMVVTVSVKVEDRMIPVVGMNLKRVDETKVGSIAE